MEPLIFERGDSIYIVATVSPFEPGQNEVEEFAFADELKKMAPSEHLMWLKGQYVEADSPNQNGQIWSTKELAIKSLTPNFMPVTVMHDPRTAVGLIADTRLLVPDRDTVPRSRIDTSLAIWRHRFPEVAEEAMENYQSGQLMQSMECISPYYECASCGQVFQKIPPTRNGVGQEKSHWCAHLNENARRILGGVVFTGTGLIFGTRGERGAFDKAHLDVFQAEVAEYHEKAHRDTGKTQAKRKPRRKHHMEIEDRRYEELLAAEQAAKRVPDLEAKLSDAEQEKAAAVKAQEESEAAKVKAEQEREEASKKIEEHEEEARKRDLATERLDKLGKGFRDALGEVTRGRVEEQAKTQSDEEWASRLEELSELTGKKPDDPGEEKPGGGSDPAKNGNGANGKEEFSQEEIARSQATGAGGNGGGSDAEPSRGSVVGKLFAGTAPAKSAGKSE